MVTISRQLGSWQQDISPATSYTSVDQEGGCSTQNKEQMFPLKLSSDLLLLAVPQCTLQHPTGQPAD